MGMELTRNGHQHPGTGQCKQLLRQSDGPGQWSGYRGRREGQPSNWVHLKDVWGMGVPRGKWCKTPFLKRRPGSVRLERTICHPSLSSRNLAIFWIRLILGVVFVMASVDKILHPARLLRRPSTTIRSFRTSSSISPAIILPWLELLLGILLICGCGCRAPLSSTNLLLVVFFGALLFNVARGLDVHCGCFSTSTEGTPTTAWYLIRDTTFVVLGCYLSVKSSSNLIRKKSWRQVPDAAPDG